MLYWCLCKLPIISRNSSNRQKNAHILNRSHMGYPIYGIPEIRNLFYAREKGQASLMLALSKSTTSKFTSLQSTKIKRHLRPTNLLFLVHKSSKCNGSLILKRALVSLEKPGHCLSPFSRYFGIKVSQALTVTHTTFPRTTHLKTCMSNKIINQFCLLRLINLITFCYIDECDSVNKGTEGFWKSMTFFISCLFTFIFFRFFL